MVTKKNATRSPTAPKVGAAPAKKPESAAPAPATEPAANPPAAAPAAADGVAAAAPQDPAPANAAARPVELGDIPLDLLESIRQDAYALGVASKGDPDEESIKQAAYKEGYSEGFSDALEGQGSGGDQADQAGEEPPEEVGYASAGYAPAVDMRPQLIALALMTPEQQRKGGIAHIVKRFDDYLQGLAPEDHYPALLFMRTIGESKPLDLATGRFTRVVNEALEALNGPGYMGSVPGEGAEDRLAAATRFDQAFPQEDISEVPEDPALANADLSDADSGASAAARMAQMMDPRAGRD